MYRDAILVDTQKWKYHYQMEHFVFVYVTHVDCYWLPHECTVTYSNPTVRCGLWGRPQASRLVTGIFFFPYHPHASTWKEFAFSCLKRYIFDCLLVALEALEKVYVTTSKINSHEVFLGAISLSAAPVSARMAEAAPVCAAALRVPRCDLCSSWTEMLCYQNPLEGIFFLYSFQGILFYLLPITDTKSLYENQMLKLLNNYSEEILRETSELHPLR